MAASIENVKLLAGLTKAPLAFANEQMQRRKADLLLVDQLTVDKEFSEAIDLLLSDNQSPIPAATTWLKAKLSARSITFEDTQVKQWLRLPATAKLLKDAARAHILEQSLDDMRAEAKETFKEDVDGEPTYGGAVFDEAVAFLVLTLLSKLSAADRILGDLVKGNTSLVVERLEKHHSEVTASIAQLSSERPAFPVEFPTEAVNQHLNTFVERESRLRSVVDPDRVTRIVNLADQTLKGQFSAASVDARVKVFRLAAAMLAREGRPQLAEPWLEAASQIAEVDLATDRARIKLLSDDIKGAIEILHDRHDDISNSLILEAIQLRDGPNAAITFYRKNLSPDQLNGFGLSNLAIWASVATEWTLAEEIFGAASRAQIAEHPLLLLFRSRFRISMMLPASLRANFVATVSELPQRSLLRNDLEGERLRKLALQDIEDLGRIATELKHSLLAEIVASHALYLRVVAADVATRNEAETELRSKLADPSVGVSWANLAFILNFQFDTTLIRTRLDRSKALGRLTSEELLAAAFISMQEGDDDNILTFVDEFRDQLAAEVTPELAFGLEIEVLAKKGRVSEARERLEAARGRLPEKSVERLTGLISDEEGEDGIAWRLAAYEESKSDRDLSLLVDALIQRNDSRAGHYASELWRLCHRIEDAVLACDEYFNAGNDIAHDEFIGELVEVIPQNNRLLEHRAWSHFRNGRLSDAQSVINQLKINYPDGINLRQLEINIAVECGDWERLSPLLRQDLDRSEHRSAKQLIQAANLAHAASDSIAMELARAAVAKGPLDPNILIAAFLIAIKQGKDWEPEPVEWLQKTIEYSDTQGPLKQASLRDVLRWQTEGEERALELNRLVMAGEMPLVLASKPLNTSLSELILARIVANIGLKDARRNLCLPLIAGNRQSWDISSFRRVALDPSAILTLQMLGLLEITINAFHQIVLPAGTFPLLLNDLEMADRSQSAKDAQAKKIKAMVSNHQIEVFADDYGDAFVHAYNRATELGGFFVHTAPVYEPKSFMEKVLDTSCYEDRLVAPQAVVRALRSAGEITEIQEQKAIAALTRAGEDWVHAPTLDLTRPLVIDGGSLNMLDHVGMLTKLLDVGAKIQVASTVLELSEFSIAQAEASRRLAGLIEDVRRALQVGLRKGKILPGTLKSSPGSFGGRHNEIEMTPLASILQDSSNFDLLVSAERSFNQHGELEDELGISRPVATPLDVVEYLRYSGLIDLQSEADAKRKMREAGIALLPVSAEEIVSAVVQSNWSHGANGALKAICKAAHLALVRRAALLPKDTPWLANVVIQYALAIKRCWTEMELVDNAAVAANYLFQNMPDIAGYSEAENGFDGRTAVRDALVNSYLLLATPIDISNERLPAYKHWHSENVARQLVGRDSDLLPSIEDRLADLVISCIPISTDAGEFSQSEVARHLASRIPKVHFDSLVKRPQVRECLDLSEPALNVAGRKVSVFALCEFIGCIIRGGEPILIDTDGNKLCSGGEIEGTAVVTEVNGKRHKFAHAALFSSIEAERTAALEEMLQGQTLRPNCEEEWRKKIATDIFSAEDFIKLLHDLSQTPEAFLETILSKPLDTEIEALVPKETEYFANLLGFANCPKGLDAFIEQIHENFEKLPATSSRLLTLGTLTAAQGIRFDRLTNHLSNEETASLAKSLFAKRDAFSVVAAFETTIGRLEDADCAAIANEIFDLLLDNDSRSKLAHHFCTAVAVTVTVLDQRSALAEWPLGVQRLATFSHAGQIARIFESANIDSAAAWEQTSNWLDLGWSIAGLLERADDGAWIREWLEPQLFSSHLLNRLRLAMGRLHEAPKEWVERLHGAITQAGMIWAAIPGPLDGLDKNAEKSSLVDAIDLLKEVEAADSAQLVRYVWGLLTVLDLRTESDKLVDVIMSKVRDISGDDRMLLIQNLFRVAAKWRNEHLADLLWNVVWDIKTQDGIEPAVLVQLAIASATVRCDERARIRCEELLVLIAHTLSPDELLRIVPSLNLIARTPGWTNCARRALGIALLAVER